MIQRNNNLSVLPFYENVSEQNHRRTYAYGEVYPLYCPMGALLPFQIIRNHNGATISSVRLYKVSDGTYTDVKTAMQNAGLTRLQYATDGYDIVMYPSDTPHNLTQTEGQHYLVITMSDGKVYTSDYFTVVADMSGFLNVRWWDLQDLVMDGCRISYANSFRNSIWLNTQLGKPEYEFEEEGETRDGYFYPEKMISEKKYKFVFLAPEYLCDVMRFVRMSDFVTVRDRYEHGYRCDTFLCTPKWEEQGDLASVEVEFTCETVAKKIGRGYVDLGAGVDFNDDYNNDYDTDNS